MKRKNIIVGQSGGPTAAINATLAGVIEAALECDGIDKVYGMRHGIEGLLRGDIIDLGKEFRDRSNLSLLAQTPSAALGSCRRKLPEPDTEQSVYAEIFDFFARYGIDCFMYIGGNDSMDTVKKLTEYSEKKGIHDISFIGVPKTIDNDLAGTDHTPGYGSAAKYIACACAEIACDCAVYTVPAVTVVEIMGRDAGWLTAAAALAENITGHGVDFIYLPERPFSDERLFADIESAFKTHPNVVIAVSEGVRYADGGYVGASGQSGVKDVFGHEYLSGTGKTLEYKIKEHFGCKVRSVEINILQRCAAHMLSRTDISESLQTGKFAVESALAGQTGVMVCADRHEGEYSVSFSCRRIEDIANAVRSVPDGYINASSNGVTEECIEYMKPLISGEVPVIYVNGLPAHFVFNK